MSTKQFNVTKWIILGGGIATIIIAIPVLGQYTGLSVDIVRTPQRLANDEANNYSFQTNVLAQLQHLTWTVDRLQHELIAVEPVANKDQYK